MKTRLPNTTSDWEKMLNEVYETQGPSGFAKYQYSIANIIPLIRTSPSLLRILEYCVDIPERRDIIVDTICEVAVNEDVDTDTRIAAATAVRAFIPRIKSYPGFKAAFIATIVQQALGRTREESLRDALTETIDAANRILQECPGHTQPTSEI